MSGRAGSSPCVRARPAWEDETLTPRTVALAADAPRPDRGIALSVPAERVWAVAAGLGLVALVAWFAVLPMVDLRRMTDLGLVSVVPIWSYVAFAVLAVAWAMTIAQPRFPTWLAAGLVVALILMTSGLPAALEGVPRFAPSYRHLGIVDFIARHGGIDPLLDAYQNWPGLFAVTAVLADLTGVHDLTPVALWAPVWLNLLYLPALFLVLDSLTDDRRLVWLAIWVFYLTDWIGQDYYSPQGIGLFLFLAVMAVTLHWLSRSDRVDPARRFAGSPADRLRWLVHRLFDRGPRRIEELGPRQRAGLVATILAVFAFVVSAHQLTPFFIVSAIGVLVLLRRVRWIGLAVLMVVMIAAWVSFMAVAFLIGHFQNVAGYVGALSESLTANVTGRIQGSEGHRFVVELRLVTTGVLWVVACLGVLRRLRHGRWDVTAVALALAPFPLFAVQAYGGEMLLRIYLFSLPFMALLAAAFVVPAVRERLSTLAAATVVVGSVLLVGGFMVTRYGNEPIESFTPDEVAAVQELYRVAPHGALLMGASGNLPWKFAAYEQYRYRPIGDDEYVGRPDEIVALMDAYAGPAYLILTRSQQEYSHLILGEPADAWPQFEREVLASGRFDVIYRNQDALIAEFRRRAPGT